jgi:vancomycin resistance protein YoaR
VATLTTSAARSRSIWPLWAGLAVLAAVGATLLLTAFAGSPAHLADGVHVAGVDVGGLTPKEAQKLLERRFEDVQRTPIQFVAGGRSFRLMAVQLGIQPDFADAVEAARREGDGFGPLRGYRRLQLRFGMDDVQPRVSVWDAAVQYKVKQLAAAVDRPPREAALVRRGLKIGLVDGRSGRVLDRRAAAQVIVSSLSTFDRDSVTLPVRTAEPKVPTSSLLPALRQARAAVSAPVRLVLAARAFRLPRWRVAQMLELPAAGRTSLRIGGPAADAYFQKLARTVETKPQDAGFAVDGPRVRILPARDGIGLDVVSSAQRILAAASTSAPREAHLATQITKPGIATSDAQKMGIVGLVGSYETIYGGDSNRRHNVQLVAHLVDKHLIRPGEEFSFNRTTGERTAAKGFLEAPVIINGELQTGLGGGICQVSTTVFNAAFEAGLSITERTNHALYISHYPLGRDATVDYPNVDLKFRNDTGHWLLLRTFVGESSLVVNLYGTPVHRKVEVETAPLRTVAPAPVERIKDPSLPPGDVVVEDYGAPAQTTSVHRRVLSPTGRLMYDSTWYSNYRSTPKIVHVGIAQPKATTTTSTTETTTTSTTETATTETATTPTTTTRQPKSPPTTTAAPASAGRT